MMNKLMCFFTGGHKYSDANIKVQTMPDDFNIVEIINPCIKCGTISISYMNMREINKTIDKILNTPIKNPTKEEAKEILKNCGILDENYDISKDYKDIFIKKESGAE